MLLFNLFFQISSLGGPVEYRKLCLLNTTGGYYERHTTDVLDLTIKTRRFSEPSDLIRHQSSRPTTSFGCLCLDAVRTKRRDAPCYDRACQN